MVGAKQARAKLGGEGLVGPSSTPPRHVRETRGVLPICVWKRHGQAQEARFQKKGLRNDLHGELFEIRPFLHNPPSV